jgi:hypothetical protein
LAERINGAVEAISNIERGNTRPGLYTLEELSDVPGTFRSPSSRDIVRESADDRPRPTSSA